MNQTARIPWALLLLVAAGVVSNCGAYGRGFGGLDTMACPELSGNVDALHAQMSADARANIKVRAFVQAAKDLGAVSLQIEAEAAEACRRMGTDIGMSAAELAAAEGPGGQAKGACGALGARIDAILRQGVSVRVSATPPACQVSAEAEANCSGACAAQIDPGEIVAHCEPARLSGFCQGRCAGHCDGTCRGQCRGACAAVDAQGNCVGTCSGDCAGSCDATCHARCEGTWQAPRCEGYVRPPSADAECSASCRAHANVNASCTPALVRVQASQNAQIAARLVATLQANMPLLLHAEVALGRRLLADAEVVTNVGAALPRIVGQAGAHALACMGAATDVTARATFSIRVSVQASASVSGRVGASG
jgi:hypothetical protein